MYPFPYIASSLEQYVHILSVGTHVWSCQYFLHIYILYILICVNEFISSFLLFIQCSCIIGCINIGPWQVWIPLDIFHSNNQTNRTYKSHIQKEGRQIVSGERIHITFSGVLNRKYCWREKKKLKEVAYIDLSPIYISWASVGLFFFFAQLGGVGWGHVLIKITWMIVNSTVSVYNSFLMYYTPEESYRKDLLKTP